jgi:hypothetical protein
MKIEVGLEMRGWGLVFDQSPAPKTWPLERISAGFTPVITLTRTRYARAALSLAGRGIG